MSKTIVLTAGGSGGHLFPAIALGLALLKRGYPVKLYTDDRGAEYAKLKSCLEAHIVPAASPFRGGIRGKIGFVFTLLRGALVASRLLRRHGAAGVVGFGGYASFPTTFMAARQNRPVILHEQNGYLSLANRKIAKMASAIALSFPTVEGIPQTSARRVETGNPVRPEINRLHKRTYIAPKSGGPFHLFIMGGSQGARVFSDVVPEAVAGLDEAKRQRLQVTQQCRPVDIKRVRSAYDAAGIDAHLQSFFDNVPDRLAATHLMVCRAGASTCAEALVAGVPAIYVPYPYAANDHQTANGRYIEKAGAGWLLSQKDFTAERLRTKLICLLENPAPLASVAASAANIGRPDAAERLADVTVSVINGMAHQDV